MDAWDNDLNHSAKPSHPAAHSHANLAGEQEVGDGGTEKRKGTDWKTEGGGYPSTHGIPIPHRASEREKEKEN